MFYPRIHFFAAHVLATLLYLCFEQGWLTAGFITGKDLNYTLSVLAVAITLGGVYLCLRLLSLQRIRQRFQGISQEEAARRYQQVAGWRTVLLLIVYLTDILLYFGSEDYASSAKYCLIIALIAAVFCWPSKSEQQSLTADNA